MSTTRALDSEGLIPYPDNPPPGAFPSREVYGDAAPVFWRAVQLSAPPEVLAEWKRQWADGADPDVRP